MAKCERREIKPEPPPVEYVLTLNEDEASFLAELPSMVETGNGFSFAIADPLREAGAPRGRWRIESVFNEMAKVHRV